MIHIGDEIPEMELDAFHKDEFIKINLSDYRGKWLVLLCYPGDFTYVCPTELEEAAKLYKNFINEGAELLSISTDSVHAHKVWHETSPAIKSIQYPMIADPSAKLCRELGTYIEEEGKSLRASFIFDPEGVCVSLEMHHNDIGRSVAEVLRKLKAAKFVKDHPGHVCPVNWEPGKETIRPEISLVGKI